MSLQDLLNSIELELIERELYPLFEAEQTAQQRAVSLPVGYEKSQALAEYWNAMAAGSATRRRREHLLARQSRVGRIDVLGATIDELVHGSASKSEP